MPVHLPVLQRLAQTNTVYQTKEEAKTDCSYCRAPCCQLIVTLTGDEPKRFECVETVLDGVKTYTLKQRADGYCVYFVHGVGCSTYDDKPWVCDYYSCRSDKRITPSHKYGPIRPIR